MALLTLVQAKGSLRVFHAEEDEDIALRLRFATAVIVNKLHFSDEDSLVAAFTPVQQDIVRGVILQVLTDIWRHRGGDAESTRWADDRVADGYLSPQITQYIQTLKDLIVA